MDVRNSVDTNVLTGLAMKGIFETWVFQQKRLYQKHSCGLPPHARAFVAEKLIESLDASPGEEFSPIWREEIRKCRREVDAGLVEKMLEF